MLGQPPNLQDTLSTLLRQRVRKALTPDQTQLASRTLTEGLKMLPAVAITDAEVILPDPNPVLHHHQS